jgi:hypothetical protein
MQPPLRCGPRMPENRDFEWRSAGTDEILERRRLEYLRTGKITPESKRRQTDGKSATVIAGASTVR